MGLKMVFYMTRYLFMATCAIALLSLFNVSPAFSAVIHVPGDQSTIQAGIDSAASGDTVLVAAGTYFESLEMKGGVSLRSETGRHDCVTIDATDHTGVVRFMSLAGPCLLEGFTIRGSNAHGLSFLESEVAVRNCLITDNYDLYMGGGVYGRDATLSFSGCIISNNRASFYGGGIYVHGSSSLTMVDCKVIGNTTSRTGGGLNIKCPASFSECTFEGNHAGSTGGGVHSQGGQIFENCTIRDNSAQREGGGVFVVGSLPQGVYPEFFGCNILDNISFEGTGGGIHGNCVLDKCRIQGNSAVVGSGGGIHSSGPIRITECLIIDNSSGKNGGGLNCTGNDSIVVDQCTIVGNSADFRGGGIYSYNTSFELTASIIAYNRKGEGVYCYGGFPALNIRLCDIFGNQGGDQLCGQDNGGNFSEDPLFCNMASGNFFLDQGSPCLIGSDPYYYVIGAWGVGDCTVAPVNDPDMVGLAADGLLGQNHPNPFNPRTVIPFVLKEPGRPVLRIFDLSGRLVKTLLRGEEFAAGQNEVNWNGRDGSGNLVPSGLYFYRLEVRDFSETRRMILMK